VIIKQKIVSWLEMRSSIRTDADHYVIGEKMIAHHRISLALWVINKAPPRHQRGYMPI